MKRMTKLLTLLTVFTLMLGLSLVTASAADIGVEPIMAEIEPIMGEVDPIEEAEMIWPDEGVAMVWNPVFDYWLQRWESEGYPDDIGGVYMHTDGNMAILVVNPSPERIEELREIFGDDVRITLARYSHNELTQVKEEIVEEFMTEDSKVWGVGVGLVYKDGVWLSPEESEGFRVGVTIDESVYEELSTVFAERFGDRVALEISGPFIPDLANDGIDPRINPAIGELDIGTDANNILWIVMVILCAGLLSTAAFMIWRRTRLVAAMQTANGNVVAQSSPAGKEQVVAAIKNSDNGPRDDLFADITKEIDKAE